MFLTDCTFIHHLPAPIWLILVLKICGFVLHLLLVNLWIFAFPLALFLNAKGGEEARFWSGRLIRQMPMYLTFGINLGIVPFLFTQLLYPQAFFPAVVLMAWYWVGIIPLMALTFVGICMYIRELGRNSEKFCPIHRAAGIASAVCILGISFLFVNAFTLTAQPELWRELWLSKSTAGAASGLALPLGEGSIWPRLGMLLGLAGGAAGVWTICDRNLFQKDVSQEYAAWSSNFAQHCASAGLILFVISELFYCWYLSQGESLDEALPRFCQIWIAGPILVFWLLRKWSQKMSRKSAYLLLGAQFFSLVLFASVRQWIQIMQLKNFLPLENLRVEADWGIVGLFFVFLTLGILALIWMVWAAIHACQTPQENGQTARSEEA